MPYITRDLRYVLNNSAKKLYKHLETNNITEGELNYLITSLIDVYLLKEGLNYKTINAIVGVLECAKLEFNRRVVAPYEDKKIQQNSDAYSPQNITKSNDENTRQ
jgi:hypothetical protein